MLNEFLKIDLYQPFQSHCPSLYVRENKVWVCWYGYPEVEHEKGKIVLARSENFGSDFTGGKVLFPKISKSQGNPVIFEAKGRLWIIFDVIKERYWNDAQLYYSSSEDDGVSWTDPKLLLPDEGLMVRHPPVQIGKDLSIPLYDEKNFSSMIYHLSVDGPSLSAEKKWAFEGALIQPQIVEKRDGSFSAYFRTAGDDFAVWCSDFVTSDNLWTGPRRLPLNCPKSGVSAVSVDDQTLVIFNNTEELKRFPLSMVGHKKDKKDLFSNIWDFDKNNLELSYPQAVSSDKKIFLVYTYNRRMIKFVRFDDLSRNVVFPEKIKNFENLHSGKNLFVLASGPSLGELDLAPLERRITMGLNRSFLLYPDTNYHCAMDARLYDEYKEEFTATRVLFSLPNCPQGHRLNLLGTQGFSEDIFEGIYSGYTVSYFALQIAQYMGFKRVFYLGLDLKHQNGQTHFFGSDFRSRDHEKGEFQKMADQLTLGARYAQKLGMEVYNCSPITDFDGIPKISYEDALAF